MCAFNNEQQSSTNNSEYRGGGGRGFNKPSNLSFLDAALNSNGGTALS